MTLNKVNTLSNSIIIFGLMTCLGLFALGYQLNRAIAEFKLQDRHITVKGLSEQEFEADVVIWPIQFNLAHNNLTELYRDVETQTQAIESFLLTNGISHNAITTGAPAITDKSAQDYSNPSSASYRYTAHRTVTVYSTDIATVRQLKSKLAELGKQGIVLSPENYDNKTEYLFTRLNDVKPEMIEEATLKAREVAIKFAKDSNSQLGKIKTATQGQFSIGDRDKNTPHIKKIRVVSTIQYYLVD